MSKVVIEDDKICYKKHENERMLWKSRSNISTLYIVFVDKVPINAGGKKDLVRVRKEVNIDLMNNTKVLTKTLKFGRWSKLRLSISYILILKYYIFQKQYLHPRFFVVWCI